MTTIFYTVSKGKSADEAFDNSVREAREINRSTIGFSGTIAEKEEFITFEGPSYYDLESVEEQAKRLMSSTTNSVLNDPYGPAGCIHIGNDEYLFFGTSFSSD